MSRTWVEILTPKPWCDAVDGGNSLKVTPELGGLYTYPCGWATALNAKHEITTNVFILHTIKSTRLNSIDRTIARTTTTIMVQLHQSTQTWITFNSGKWLIFYIYIFLGENCVESVCALSVSLVNLRLMVSESDRVAFIWISLPSLLSPMTTVLTFIQ